MNHEQSAAAHLKEAIRSPLEADLPKLGASLVCMFAERFKAPSTLYSLTINELQFNVKDVAFKLSIIKKGLSLEFRHAEAIKWQNAKFNNRKKNKIKEIEEKVKCFVFEKRPTPFI